MKLDATISYGTDLTNIIQSLPSKDLKIEKNYVLSLFEDYIDDYFELICYWNDIVNATLERGEEKDTLVMYSAALHTISHHILIMRKVTFQVCQN